MATSSVDDVIRLCRANMLPDDTLLGRALAATHARRHPVSAHRAIGLAWHIDRTSDLVWINGQTGGSHGFVIDPRNGSGVEVLNNSATSVDDVASTRLLKRYLARSLYRLLQHQEPLMA